MAVRSDIKVDVIECDNPNCKRIQMYTEAEIMPVGMYVGEVIHHSGAGGNGGQWFACSAKCIKYAVQWITGTFEERRAAQPTESGVSVQ